MSDALPRTKTQQRLSRGAIVFCLVMFLWFTFGPSEAVYVSVENDAKIYSSGILATVFPMVALGAVTAVLALVFWLQRQPLFRCVSIVLAALSLFMFVIAPTGINHRVVVDSQHVSRTVGAWYSPTTQRVDFDDVAYLQIVDDGFGSAGHQRFALQCCNRHTGEFQRLPLSGLMREALSEIFRRASERDILTMEYKDGSTIPTSLMGREDA